MKVMLKSSVRSLGRAGEIVSVRGGYARNYLFPRGVAIPAGEVTEQLISRYTAHRAAEEARRLDEARETAARIAAIELVLHLKANAVNHLYGSVTAGEIVTRLDNRHIVVEKSMIQLDEPLKTLGQYSIPIRLAEGVEAVLKIDVRDEHGDIPVLEGHLDLDETPEEAPAADAGEGDTPLAGDA